MAPALTVGALVSRVKVSVSETALVTPPVSVCRTVTDFAPSPLRVRLVPWPSVQVVSPLVLYSQLAPSSRPLTLTVPALVTPSVRLEPLSLANAIDNLAGATAVTSACSSASVSTPEPLSSDAAIAACTAARLEV